MTDETKNVFVSHIHEDDPGLGKLKSLLKDNGMVVRDYSISADNSNNAHSEDYIKSEILAPRIQQTSVMVVYVSPETKDSEYVNWEIEYAQKHDKRIVGVWADGEGGCELRTRFPGHTFVLCRIGTSRGSYLLTSGPRAAWATPLTQRPGRWVSTSPTQSPRASLRLWSA